MTELLHITDRATWDAAVAAGEYRISTRGVSLEEQGFIHFSSAHQLRRVAEFLYGDPDDPGAQDLVVLVVDEARLEAPVRYEPAEPGGESFPHLYGPLPIDTVTEVVQVDRDAAGRLVLPGRNHYPRTER